MCQLKGSGNSIVDRFEKEMDDEGIVDPCLDCGKRPCRCDDEYDR